MAEHDNAFWVRWFPERFLNSPKVRFMSAAQRGMYITLLSEQASSSDGYLPLATDDARFWRITGAASLEEWKENSDQVMEAFPEETDDGRHYNGVMRACYEDSVGRVHESSSKAKKAAEARWDAIRNAPSIATSIAPSNAHTNKQTNIQSISSEPESGSSDLTLFGESKPKTRITDSFRREVFDYYLEATGKTPSLYLLTDKRKGKLDAITRVLLDPERCAGDLTLAANAWRHAIDGLSSSGFHMGRDPKTNGEKYNEFERHLAKDWEQFEKWLNAPRKKKPQSVGA